GREREWPQPRRPTARNAPTVHTTPTIGPTTSLPGAPAAPGAARSTISVMMALANNPVAPPARADRAAILPHASAHRAAIAMVVPAWVRRIRAAIRWVAASRAIMVLPGGLESARSIRTEQGPFKVHA